jgi:hypothetical protein
VRLSFSAGPIGLVAVLALGACGSSEPPVPERVTACEVVTAGEVADAIGLPVQAPAGTSEAATDQLAGRSGCAWSSRDGSRAVLVELVRTRDISRSVRRTGFSATARYRAAATDHPEGESVDGVGDRALFVDEASKLWVLAGDDLVSFEVAVTPTTDARTMAVALARDAVARLHQQAD